MRTFAILSLAATAAGLLAITGAVVVSSNEDDDGDYTAYVLQVAADAIAGTPIPFFTATSEPTATPDPAMFELVGECVSAPGFMYSVHGYEFEAAPADFYYSHLFGIEETFTHTGPLGWQGSGPGGFAVGGEAGATDGFADIVVPLPGTEGLYTFALEPSPGVAIAGPPITFTLPGDCAPFDLRDWSPTLVDAAFPMQFTTTPAWHGGNCAGFSTTLTITIEADGTVTFFQHDTGDLNSGSFWPVPGAFEFLVRNQDHPEAYAGTFSPDFSSFSGETVWNNECHWMIGPAALTR